MSFVKFFFKACNIVSYPFTNWISEKNVCMEKNIIYDNTNPSILTADLYYVKPENSRPVPIFLNIHGGGFVEGDKKYRKGFAITMAKLGYFVVNINYGLCPEYKFPYFVNNVISAINWISDNANRYNLDIEQLVISGDSSGSFVAAVSTAAITNQTFREKLAVPLCKARPTAALLYCGLYDLRTVCDNKGFFGKKFSYGEVITGKREDALEAEGFFKLIAPDNYITADFPPTFITYSNKDLMCKGTSLPLIEAMKKKKVPYKIFEANNIEDIHCFHLRPIIRNAKICISSCAEFLTDSFSVPRPIALFESSKELNELEDTAKEDIQTTENHL